MLLAIDPGKTTGWSIWSFEKEKPLKLIELGQTEGGVDGYLSSWWDRNTWCEVIVSEQFVLDGRTPNPDITPLKIEGVLMAYVKQFGGELVFQRNNFNFLYRICFHQYRFIFFIGINPVISLLLIQPTLA